VVANVAAAVAERRPDPTLWCPYLITITKGAH